MADEEVVVTVGAGPCGVATSACLHNLSIPNLVRKREDCLASLRAKKRYDRLRLQIPKYPSKDQFVRHMENYASKFKLSLSATGDLLSQIDPMVVVHAMKKGGELEEIGRTEVIMNSLDPVWIEKDSIVYQFEISQLLVFHVYGVDTKYKNLLVKTLKLDDKDFVGQATCFLSEIVKKNNNSLILELIGRDGQGGNRNQGALIVHAEEITVSSRQASAVDMRFPCSNLENKDVCSKSDPSVRTSRIVEGGIIPIHHQHSLAVKRDEYEDIEVGEQPKERRLSLSRLGVHQSGLEMLGSYNNHILALILALLPIAWSSVSSILDKENDCYVGSEPMRTVTTLLLLAFAILSVSKVLAYACCYIMGHWVASIKDNWRTDGVVRYKQVRVLGAVAGLCCTLTFIASVLVLHSIDHLTEMRLGKSTCHASQQRIVGFNYTMVLSSLMLFCLAMVVGAVKYPIWITE